jgi:hypothetical protein
MRGLENYPLAPNPSDPIHHQKSSTHGALVRSPTVEGPTTQATTS